MKTNKKYNLKFALSIAKTSLSTCVDLIFPSTIIDFSGDEPQVIREGKGSLEIF